MAILDPKPGFTVKTRVVALPQAQQLGRKLFVNVCHDPQVPKPQDTEFVPETVFPKIVTNEWEIPIIVSLPKEVVDKKGSALTAIDCCINSTCFTWIQLFIDLKKIVIEWCLEAIEVTNDITLDRDYTIPKMLSKGELTKTEINDDELAKGPQAKLEELQKNEPLNLLHEVQDADGDVDMDGTSLPPLVPQPLSRPLIEEVTTSPASGSTNSTPKASSSTSTANTLLDPDPEDSDLNEPTQIDYQLSFTDLENEKFNLLVKLHSPQLTPQNVLVSLKGMDLIIVPREPLFFSTLERNLVVPLRAPKATQPRCFFVTPESTLYVFI